MGAVSVAPTVGLQDDSANAQSDVDEVTGGQMGLQMQSFASIDSLFEPSSALPGNELALPSFAVGNLHEDDLFDFGHLWTPLPDAQFFFDDTEFFDPRLFALDSIEQSELPSPTLRFTTSMQVYFDAKSRPSSPSRDRSAQMWYSKPASLANHSPDVLKVFIGLFRKHIPPTFAVFAEESGRSTTHSVSYILAMGAVGGLYSKVTGSADHAKVMYNDARRLALAELSEERMTPITSEVGLERAKTAIILGIYGLSSGNKRSFEFVEAFQSDLTNAIRMYDMVYNTENELGEGARVARLLAAMYILDCYRVVIMMRPPSLMWRQMSRILQATAEMNEPALLRHAVQQLTDGTFRTTSYGSGNTASLAAMATLLWSCIPRHTQRDTTNELCNAARQPHSALVEVALEKWYQSQDVASPDVTPLLLFHAMQIILHTDMPTLQVFAYADAESSRRSGRAEDAHKALHLWLQSREYETAHWHAEQIITLAESAVAHSQPEHRLKAQPTTVDSRPVDPRTTLHEAAHVPYAIYYATLVMYVRDAAIPSKTPASTVRAPIIRGERLLNLLRVDVAQPLARVLCDVA